MFPNILVNVIVVKEVWFLNWMKVIGNAKLVEKNTKEMITILCSVENVKKINVIYAGKNKILTMKNKILNP